MNNLLERISIVCRDIRNISNTLALCDEEDVYYYTCLKDDMVNELMDLVNKLILEVEDENKQ